MKKSEIGLEISFLSIQHFLAFEIVGQKCTQLIPFKYIPQFRLTLLTCNLSWTSVHLSKLEINDQSSLRRDLTWNHNHLYGKRLE